MVTSIISQNYQHVNQSYQCTWLEFREALQHLFDATTVHTTQYFSWDSALKIMKRLKGSISGDVRWIHYR